jgi:mannose-6-phosphate isomerase class I
MKYSSFHNYDPYPSIRVAGDACAAEGWEALRAEIRKHISGGRCVAVCEMYPGTDADAALRELRKLSPSAVIDTRELLLPKEKLMERVYGDQGDDRVFGLMTHRTLDACFDAEKLSAARERIEEIRDGLVLVCGTGASLAADGDVLLYFNITRWEIQLRYRKGQGNWGLDNGDAPLLTKYKYGYFVLWRMADRLKTKLLPRVDLMIDANDPEKPKAVAGAAYLDALDQAARQPFRVRPYFDPGVWGGQWIRKQLEIPTEAANLAWGFDGVPEENGLGLTFGDITLEFPAIDLVLTHPHELLGERVHGRFGAEFPIRFDLLDTMEGGNLSLQVHPLTEYIQQQFGMHYTQDESYYILEADEGKDPAVYLGIRTGTRPEEMTAALEEAQKGGAPFDAEKYVNRIPVKKHDHLLIPAGTVHCSGADTVVLEISATPYIFTFKLWDWGRIGLDGLPRPIHIEHGKNNIQWDRNTEWVHRELVNRTETVHREEGVLAERTGLHPREFLETVRYTLSKPYTCRCNDSVHVINLVEGKEMTVESPDGSFPPFTVHYAETAILPAAIGGYRLCPTAGSPEIKVIGACVRP